MSSTHSQALLRKVLNVSVNGESRHAEDKESGEGCDEDLDNGKCGEGGEAPGLDRGEGLPRAEGNEELTGVLATGCVPPEIVTGVDGDPERDKEARAEERCVPNAEVDNVDRRAEEGENESRHDDEEEHICCSEHRHGGCLIRGGRFRRSADAEEV